MRYFYKTGQQAKIGDKVFLCDNEEKHIGEIIDIVEPFSQDARNVGSPEGGCFISFLTYGDFLMSSIDEDIELCPSVNNPPQQKINFKDGTYFYQTGEPVIVGDKISIDEKYTAVVVNITADNLLVHYLFDEKNELEDSNLPTSTTLFKFDDGTQARVNVAEWHYFPYFDKYVKLLARSKNISKAT